MRKRRDSASFALEARQRVGIVRQVLRQDLDRDVATEPRIARPVHLTHSPGADRSSDFVRAEAGTGNKRHGVDRRIIAVLAIGAATQRCR
jgi:hypothetical protein